MKDLKQHELEQVAGGYNFRDFRKDWKDFWKEMGDGFSKAGDALSDAWKEAREAVRNN
ncbi:hypothetical protein [Neisseria sicca]|uniref:hypothetical protein n=1 Tax=Neisseria sicca TaxID=490 RepID=UPI000310D19F|nr:hypothetical protein [Neisseria sicca]